MATQSADTAPEAERVQLALLRRATDARLFRMTVDMSRDMLRLSWHGAMRQRHGLTAGQAAARCIREWYDGLERPGIGDLLSEGAEEKNTIGMHVGDLERALIGVVDALDELGCPYFITGSVAGSLHGLPRLTRDVDIVAMMREDDATALRRILAPAYYCDEHAMVDAVRRGRSFNAIHLDTVFKVDVFVLSNRMVDQERLQRRRSVTLSEGEPGRTYFVASPEDIILSKLEWRRAAGGSEQQWRDVLGILKKQGDALDMTYVRRWAATLGVLDALEEAVHLAT